MMPWVNSSVFPPETRRYVVTPRLEELQLRRPTRRVQKVPPVLGPPVISLVDLARDG